MPENYRKAKNSASPTSSSCFQQHAVHWQICKAGSSNMKLTLHQSGKRLTNRWHGKFSHWPFQDYYRISVRNTCQVYLISKTRWAHITNTLKRCWLTMQSDCNVVCVTGTKMCVDTSALLRDPLSHPIIWAVRPHQPLLQDDSLSGW